MFGFKPVCPIDPCAKRWIEDRLQWLTDQFGLDIFTRRAVVLPSDEFFSDPFDGHAQTTRELFDRVCRYMDVEPDDVDLQLYTEDRSLELVNEDGHALGGTAGLYQQGEFRATVRLERSELFNPVSMIGTLAHELAHVRLMGDGRVAGDEFDNELLTDLTVVFHGLGIFLANTPRNWMSDMTYWPGTTLQKPEYMSPPMFGYALAHCAWFRDELQPRWAKHLEWGARANLKQALKYLIKTGESSFRPKRVTG